MVASQIGQIVEVNTWVSLDDEGIRAIGLIGDNNIFVSPATEQYYFDNSSDVLFIRKLSGRVEKITPTENVDESIYAKIFYNGNVYKTKYLSGGINDPEIGRYHTVISYDNICGFYK